MPKAIQNMNVGDTSYSQAIQNIDAHRNTPVRWGGIIISVENENNFSLIQVLSYPLDYSGRPLLNEEHEGRFLIKSTKFLDPIVYAKKNEISVVGKLDGDLQLTIGKRTIRAPLILSTGIHIWPKRHNRYRHDKYRWHPYGYYSYPFFRGGWYYPFRY
tara:strand:- start:25438 stop:25911 length:474 start_codon:yes stop_codon:yes gene_type:complete